MIFHKSVAVDRFFNCFTGFHQIEKTKKRLPSNRHQRMPASKWPLNASRAQIIIGSNKLAVFFFSLFLYLGFGNINSNKKNVWSNRIYRLLQTLWTRFFGHTNHERLLHTIFFIALKCDRKIEINEFRFLYHLKTHFDKKELSWIEIWCSTHNRRKKCDEGKKGGRGRKLAEWKYEGVLIAGVSYCLLFYSDFTVNWPFDD